MVARCPNLMSRNGYYYFRYVVPVAMGRKLNLRELTYSLKTKEYMKAKVLCMRILNMAHGVLNQLFSNQEFVQLATLEPSKAKSLAQKYFKACMEREMQQFEIADMHSHLIATQGIPENVQNREEYLRDPTRTAKRLDFLYPDFEPSCLTLYDDQTITQGLDRERIYNAVKRNNGLENLLPNTHSGQMFKQWMNRAISACLEVHNQKLSYEADIETKDTHFDYKELVYDGPVPLAKEPFSKVVEKYLDEFRQSTTSPRSVLKKEAAFKLWTELHGDTSFGEIDKAKGRLFKEMLLKLPCHFTKRHKGLKLADLDDKTVPQKDRIDRVSVNGYLGAMSSIYTWAKKNDDSLGENPFSGLSLKVKKKANELRKPFRDEHLKAIFALPLFVGCETENRQGRYREGKEILWDSYYWLPLLGCFTGARMQEICQLEVSDIKSAPKGHYIDINDNGPDKYLKNENSRRKVPIHPQLISLGFLEFVEAAKKNGNRDLFPDIPNGAGERRSSVYSRRFLTLRKKAKVTEKGLCFHSFRHSFIDALRNAGVHPYINTAMTGHVFGSNSVHDSYGIGPNLEVLFDAIGKVSFPVVLKRKP